MKRSSRIRGDTGFTLIELMVSCAILGILVAGLSGALSGFTQVTGFSSKRMETRKDASSVYNRLGFDFAAGINTGGVSYQFLKNSRAASVADTSNDAMMFLAKTLSTDANSRLAVLGYDVDETTNQAKNTTYPTLMRHVQPFLWTDDASQISLTAAAEKQPLTPGVFRMELAFLKTDGTIAANPPAISEIEAVICALAILDADTLAMLSGPQKLSLVQALPDAIDGEAPLSRWHVDLPGLRALPVPVVQNIHFRQRYYYLK